jgi:hypothetical protein
VAAMRRVSDAQSPKRFGDFRYLEFYRRRKEVEKQESAFNVIDGEMIGMEGSQLSKRERQKC